MPEPFDRSGPSGNGRLIWAEVEAAVSPREGWVRAGRVEYHGPCPVTGAGTDRCWVHRPRDGGPVLVGCRGCGGPGGGLAAADFVEHLVALGLLAGPRPDRARRARPRAGPGPRRRRRPSSSSSPDPSRCRALWAASCGLDGTPGAVYLAGRACLFGSAPLDVRWIGCSAAMAADCRPVPPPDAAGLILYRAARPCDSATDALHVEAVDAAGRPLEFGRAGKRPAVKGSLFLDGARVFLARAGVPGAGVWLAEGLIDPLALVSLARLDFRAGPAPPFDAAVAGTCPGPMFTVPAVDGFAGPVVLACQDDAPDVNGRRPSQERAKALRTALLRAGRPDVTIVRPSRLDAGSDWGDRAMLYALDLAERSAVQSEDLDG